MKNQFVTYEISKKLQGLGYDDICIGNYEKKWNRDIPVFNIGTTHNWNELPLCWSAPLWQQVIDWFIEKHNVYYT